MFMLYLWSKFLSTANVLVNQMRLKSSFQSLYVMIHVAVFVILITKQHHSSIRGA
ncbi:hypothetical protein Hanom_Chr10g00911921 [Helianthus anomalus]